MEMSYTDFKKICDEREQSLNALNFENADTVSNTLTAIVKCDSTIATTGLESNNQTLNENYALLQQILSEEKNRLNDFLKLPPDARIRNKEILVELINVGSAGIQFIMSRILRNKHILSIGIGGGEGEVTIHYTMDSTSKKTLIGNQLTPDYLIPPRKTIGSIAQKIAKRYEIENNVMYPMMDLFIDEGTKVQLSARACELHDFSGWEGATSSSPIFPFEMKASYRVKAVFKWNETKGREWENSLVEYYNAGRKTVMSALEGLVYLRKRWQYTFHFGLDKGDIDAIKNSEANPLAYLKSNPDEPKYYALQVPGACAFFIFPHFDIQAIDTELINVHGFKELFGIAGECTFSRLAYPALWQYGQRDVSQRVYDTGEIEPEITIAITNPPTELTIGTKPELQAEVTGNIPDDANVRWELEGETEDTQKREAAQRDLEPAAGGTRPAETPASAIHSDKSTEEKQKLIADKNKEVQDFIKLYEEGFAFDWVDLGWLSEDYPSAKLNKCSVGLSHLIKSWESDSRRADLISNMKESWDYIYGKIGQIRKPEVISSLKALRINATTANTLEEVKKACEEYEQEICRIVTENEKSFQIDEGSRLLQDIPTLLYNDVRRSVSYVYSPSKDEINRMQKQNFQFPDEVNELLKIFGYEVFYVSRGEIVHPDRLDIVGHIQMKSVNFGTIIVCAFPGMRRIEDKKTTIKPKVIVSE